MGFEELSPNAEKLLQDILQHRDNATEYWKTRFDSLSSEEDAGIRSLFDELEDSGMIDPQWADDFPYGIIIKDRGLTYSARKKAYIKEKNKLSRREWCIAIVAAVFGAVIGLIPAIVQWIGGN